MLTITGVCVSGVILLLLDLIQRWKEKKHRKEMDKKDVLIKSIEEM